MGRVYCETSLLVRPFGAITRDGQDTRIDVHKGIIEAWAAYTDVAADPRHLRPRSHEITKEEDLCWAVVVSHLHVENRCKKAGLLIEHHDFLMQLQPAVIAPTAASQSSFVSSVRLQPDRDRGAVPASDAFSFSQLRAVATADRVDSRRRCLVVGRAPQTITVGLKPD